MAESGEQRKPEASRRSADKVWKLVVEALRRTGPLLVRGGTTALRMTRSLANYLANVAEDAKQRRRLTNARRHLERGNILAAEDQDDQAVIAEFLQPVQGFTQAAAYNPRLTPQLADAYFKLGSAHDKMGQRKEAVDNFAETLLRDPSLTPQVALSHYNRGKKADIAGNRPLAIDDYTQL